MTRQIYTVDAWIVDANGTYNKLSGYPKTFDSKNYSNDADKARKRADGDFSEVWGAFCKRDDRMIQTVVMTDINGLQLGIKSMGSFPDEQEPEPEVQPEGE